MNGFGYNFGSDSSGETNRPPTGRSNGVALVTASSVTGPRHAPALSGGTHTGETEESTRAARTAAGTPTSPRVLRTRRDAVLALDHARRELESAVEAELFDERMNGVLNAAEALRRAWETSAGLEDQFREIVNVCQILLWNAKPEEYSPRQLRAVAEAVGAAADSGDVTGADVARIVGNLVQEGLPVFRALE